VTLVRGVTLVTYVTFVSLSCVIGHLMCHRRLPTTDFQSCREGRGREGGWGHKVLSRPSADSFAVGQRQKIVHDKDINDSQGQDQEELMMKYFTSINVLLTCRKYTF
jgi:hypothetical protein